MGLIKNVLNSVGNVVKDVGGSAGGALLGGLAGAANQAVFQEYYTSGTMAGDILMKRAEQVRTNGTKNTKSDANIISSGSVIDVQHNQCMIIVENGKVVEACMEPGRFTYDTSLAPSFLEGEGKFGERFKNVAKEVWNQAKMGGQRKNTQRIYFINTGILDKSIFWGVGNVQFRHTQQFVTNAAPYIVGVRVKGNGMARVRIQRPLDFYEQYGAKFAGADEATCISLSSMEEFFKSCKSSMIQAITGAITDLGAKQPMMYEDITTSDNLEKIAIAVNERMDDTDVGRMGFDFYQFTANELLVRDEDMEKIQKAQEQAYEVGNANLMNYKIQTGMVDAMKTAGENAGVAGVGMLGMMGGGQMFQNMGNIQQQPVQQFAQPTVAAAAAAPSAHVEGWKCACGATVTGNFCNVCGAKKPEPKPVDNWKCECGHVAEGNFCPNCGSKRPAPKAIEGWICTCGNTNKGKFCPNCGSKKPVGAPLYQCDKCGWKPTDPQNPPKFCPECGDVFDENDVQ